MNSDINFDTSHLEGNVILDIEVKSNGNGTHKASAMGVEVNHKDQAQAIRELQDQLQQKILSGEIRPGM
jgi:hypothetical protein